MLFPFVCLQECDFLKNALTIPWTLSTSQQPQRQIPNVPDCNDLKFKDMVKLQIPVFTQMKIHFTAVLFIPPQISPGGGFGPVSDDGYGVSYMIPGERRIFFHVSSKRASAATNSRRFMQTLFQSFNDIQAIFSDK